MNWHNARAHSVVLNGAISVWWIVTSRALQTSIFINNLNARVQCIISECANESKVGGSLGPPEGQVALQRDLRKLIINVMKFKKSKCQALCLRQNNARHNYGLGDECPENTLQKET